MYNQQNQFQYGGSSSSTATGFQGQQAGGFGFGGANTGNVGGPGGAFSGAAGFQQMGGPVTSPRGSQTPAFGAAASGVASSTAEKAKDLASSAASGTKAVVSGLMSRVTRGSTQTRGGDSVNSLPGLGAMDASGSAPGTPGMGGMMGGEMNQQNRMSMMQPQSANMAGFGAPPPGSNPGSPGLGGFGSLGASAGAAKGAAGATSGDRTMVTRCRNLDTEITPITKLEEQYLSMIPTAPFILRIRALASGDHYVARWLGLNHHAFTPTPLVLHEVWQYEAFAKQLLAPDDGLFRTRSNLRDQEPWNHWRLLLQLMREKMAVARKCQDIADYPNVMGQNAAPSGGGAPSQLQLGPLMLARQQQQLALGAAAAGSPGTANELEQLCQAIIQRKKAVLPTWQQYYSELEFLIHFLDYEIVSVRQTVPVFVNAERTLFKFMNNFRAERMQLKAEHMFSLKICLETLTLTSLQQGLGVKETSKNANAAALLESLYGEEDRLTAKLLQHYDEYHRREEGDPIDILDGRFDALVAYGQTLREAVRNFQPTSADPAADEQRRKNLEDRWALHVQERQKFRQLRTEVERERNVACDALYKTWQQLRGLRAQQSFTSTPVRLDVVVVSHNAEEDQRRVAQYLNAEVEEQEWLFNQQNNGQQFDSAGTEARLRDWYATNWRQPGADTHRFELSWRRDRVTNMDDLRNVSLKEFERRRRLQSGALRFEVTCVVNGEQVGTSGPLPLQWDSWSTSANLSNILDHDLGAVADLARADCPMARPDAYTFDLCVHTMPRTIELQVWVGVPRALGIFSHGSIRKYSKVGACHVAIPSGEHGTSRVTHTPIIRQKLCFGADEDYMGAQSGSTGQEQQRHSYVEGTSTKSPRSTMRESQARFELQAAMNDANRTTGVMKIRTFWPLPIHKAAGAGAAGALPPQPLAETTVMESLHRAFEEGHNLPFFSRFSSKGTGGKADGAAGRASALLDGDPGQHLIVSRTQKLLDELRFDPNHPLVQQSRDELDSLVHMHSSTNSTSFDPFLKLRYCGFRLVQWGNVTGSRRFQKLAIRAQKGATGAGGDKIAATDKEVRMQQISANARAILTGEDTTQEGAAVQVKLPNKASVSSSTPRKSEPAADGTAAAPSPPQDPSAAPPGAAGTPRDAADAGAGGASAQEDFISAIQARTRMVSAVKRKYSVRSVVREHGQDAEEIDWAAIWLQLQNLLKPKRPLKPTMQQRMHDPSSKRAGIHINVAKLYNVPLRLPSALDRMQQRTGFTVSEVVVELAFENMDKMQLKADTGHRVPGLNPDVNQHRVFPLASGQNPNVSLSGDALNAFTNSIHFNVFDETEIPLGGGGGGADNLGRSSQMGGMGSSSSSMGGGNVVGGFKRERRYLGTFAVPWPTVLANDCKVEGRFRVKTPVGIIGYQKPPSQAAQQRMSTGGIDPNTGAPIMAGGDADDEEPLLLFASITLDRVLTEPDSGAATIIPGKESRAVLNHVHQWMSSLGSDRIIKENLAQALGTDIEGRSRLITRYITPQEPPTDVVGDVLNDPYAIEKCARYVSLITFLTDAQMFEGRAVDLWCTSKTFLDIGCGDYEEHAILLCNYFNFIDGKRGEVNPSHKVASYCVSVDAIPDGDGMYVMRQDQTSGDCEFWDPITNRCYFVPRRAEAFYKQAAAAIPVDLERGHAMLNVIPGVSAVRDCVKRFRSQEQRVGRFTGSQGARPSAYGTTCPIQKVSVVFSADNVWYNRLRHRAESRSPGTAAESPVLKMDFDLENSALWRPLFVDESEKKHLFPDGLIETLQPPLRYDPPDLAKSKNLQGTIEDEIWKRFLRARAEVNLRTRSNAAIAGKCRDMLDALELFKNTKREGGNEATAPLRMAASGGMGVGGPGGAGGGFPSAAGGPLDQSDGSGVRHPVSRPDLDAFFLQLEEEFGGHRGLRVYGVPLNSEISDVNQLWQAVINTNLIALGSDDAEFSVAVRVYPYSQNILSIWIFLVCVTA